MDRGAWWATAHRAAKSQTRLKQLGTHTHIPGPGHPWINKSPVGIQTPRVGRTSALQRSAVQPAPCVGLRADTPSDRCPPRKTKTQALQSEGSGAQDHHEATACATSRKNVPSFRLFSSWSRRLRSPHLSRIPNTATLICRALDMRSLLPGSSSHVSFSFIYDMCVLTAFPEV